MITCVHSNVRRIRSSFTRSEPPMPMLTISVILRPVYPFQSPDLTSLTKPRIWANTRFTSGITCIKTARCRFEFDQIKHFLQQYCFHLFQQVYNRYVCLSVDVSKRHVAILAQPSREMSQTVRIDWQYILSRVRVSVRPTIFWHQHFFAKARL